MTPEQLLGLAMGYPERAETILSELSLEQLQQRDRVTLHTIRGLLAVGVLPSREKVTASLKQMGRLDAAGGTARLTDLVIEAPQADGKSGQRNGQASAPGVIMQRACDIAVQAIRWLWPYWLARGKFHIVAGQAGTGKTSIVLALLATITTGRRWPDGAPGPDPANVLIWSAEDGASDTIVPRLMAAGADLPKVHIISGIQTEGASRPFDPATDLDQLVHIIRELKPVALMVDPIVSAVAGDSHKNAETRRGLQPLVDLAERFDMAIVGISHFSKGTTGREPMERVTGSLAFAALARIVLAAAKLPEDNPHGCERILARAKSNIGPDDGAIGYRLNVAEAAPGIEVGQVEWQSVIDGTARELLAEPVVDDEGGALGEARAFLENYLARGPKAAQEILTASKRAGISERTLKRAKAAIGVKAAKSGLHSGWQWCLPTVPTNPEECHHKSLASFEQFEECQQFEVASFGEDDGTLPFADLELPGVTP